MVTLWTSQESMLATQEISPNSFLRSLFTKCQFCKKNTHKKKLSVSAISTTLTVGPSNNRFISLLIKILNEYILKAESVPTPCYDWNNSCQIIQRHFVKFKKSETSAWRSVKHIKIWPHKQSANFCDLDKSCFSFCPIYWQEDDLWPKFLHCQQVPRKEKNLTSGLMAALFLLQCTQM